MVNRKKWIIQIKKILPFQKICLSHSFPLKRDPAKPLCIGFMFTIFQELQDQIGYLTTFQAVCFS